MPDFLARTAYNQAMRPASLLPSDIADHLGRGGTVVTGNQRAARTLRLAFDRACRTSGLACWQSPEILAWDTWTAALYRKLLLDGQATRVLLNRTQELQLWRSAIEADSQWTSLQTIDALASLAAEAWQLLCAYRGQKRLARLGGSGDTRSFERWVQAFTGRCRSNAYLCAAELEETLVNAGNLESPAAGILLAGFDSRTPAQQALIDAFRGSGCSVEEGQPQAVAASLYISAAETPEDELSQTAFWIRSFLQANPRATVAVIVPSLAAERREIDRVFRQILAPELEAIAATAASPYEFSLGQPLASSPIVSLALDLLRFATGALSITSISRVLLSPYFAGGADELSARAEFDGFEVRNIASLRPEMTLGRLILLAAASQRASRLTGLLSQLRSFDRTASKLLADSAAKQRPFADWAETIRELLQSSGWPGAGPLDSIEFQTRRKFDLALDELATLDFEGIRPGFGEALAHLEQILERTLFAPESREAPVQILSPMEAAGSRFDALCFLRASDLGWPVRPAINPLLGWRVQRELGMPGSDAALDFAYARRITKRIAASAETVVYSYAKHTIDGHQRPSPILDELHPESLAAPPIQFPLTPIKLETFEEDAFIPLTNFNVAGGAKTLKLQAACGFRAFAEQRLRSTPIEAPEPGMDALERGNIVHAALDHIWNDLRTQAALRALTPEQRAAQLSRSIEHSLERAAAKLAADSTASAWDAAYLNLQRQRLSRLLAPWLNLELDRPAFEVELREKSEAAAIGPLSLKIRIDRVDRLLDEAGGRILLDYKTGVAKPGAWAGERPDEPQIPLYAVLHMADSLAAVAFANIRAGGDLALEGYTARGGALPKSARPQFKSFKEQLDDWHRVLTALAQDFAAGDARVRPKSYPVTCRHCAQRIFCRLDPASLVIDEDAEDSEQADA